MSADAVIVRAGPVAVPLDYKLPTGTEIVPKVVTATLDGTNAGSSFLAVLEIISPDGTVTARCLRQEAIAAGASASVSWFPGGGVDDSAATDVDTAAGVTAIASPAGTLSVSSPTGPTADVDMPATGVGAGTYGDATHVSEVTVDAEGRVTNAVSVPISGSGGAGGLIVVYDSGYLGADAASIDTGAGGVASGHVGLIIVAYLRSTNAVANDNIGITFNNDTAAHYSFERITASGGAVSSSYSAGQSEGLIGVMPGATAPASFFGGLYATIPAYDGTANFKTAHGHSDAVDSGSVSEAIANWVTVWNQATAISRIRIRSQAGGGNLKAGSRVIIYGMQ